MTSWSWGYIALVCAPLAFLILAMLCDVLTEGMRERRRARGKDRAA